MHSRGDWNTSKPTSSGLKFSRKVEDCESNTTLILQAVNASKRQLLSYNHCYEILDMFDSFCCLRQKAYKTGVKKDEECSIPHKCEISIVVLIRDTKGWGNSGSEEPFGMAGGLSVWWEIILVTRVLRCKHSHLCTPHRRSSVCAMNTCWLYSVLHPVFVFSQSFCWSSSKSTSSLLSCPVAENSGGGMEYAQVTSQHSSCDWEGKQTSGMSPRVLKGKM